MKTPWRTSIPALAVLLLLVVGITACGFAEKDPKIVLMAIDGLEWDLLLPRLAAGEMPHLQRLIEGGRAGLLETTQPTLSPIIWTTIATGKPREEHRIRGFATRDGEGQRVLTSYDRRTKALWNILSDYDRSVAVVGWWMTYPAEEINGVMVAQVNTLDQTDRKGGVNILKGGLIDGLGAQVHPPERLEAFLQIHRRIEADLDALTESIFGAFRHSPSALVGRLWQNTLWAFRSDATYVAIAEILADEDFDLLAFYMGGADVVAHRFWRHMDPDTYRYPPSKEELEDYGDLVEDYYRYVDECIGRVLAQAPRNATVLVVSDHGMQPINKRKRFDPDDIPNDINSAHHHHAPPGVIIAAGPGIESAAIRSASELVRNDLPTLGSISDIAPTVLAILGVPVGEDMTGTPLRTIVGDDVEIGTVRTHDDRKWRAARRRLDPRDVGRTEDSERLEQLRALGYIN